MSRGERLLIAVVVLCVGGLLVPPTWYEALLGVLVGAAISYFVSWYFYQRAADELKDKAEELRQTTEHAIRMLQTIGGGGRPEAIPDEEGKTKGVAHFPKPITDRLDTNDSVEDTKRSDEDGSPEG